MVRFQSILSLLSIGIGVLPVTGAAQDHPIAILKVHTGAAALRQQGRLTILDIEFRPGHTHHIALTHPAIPAREPMPRTQPNGSRRVPITS